MDRMYHMNHARRMYVHISKTIDFMLNITHVLEALELI